MYISWNVIAMEEYILSELSDLQYDKVCPGTWQLKG